MPFDTKKFLKTKFQHRIEEVPVPDLKDYFQDGATPVWRVRGLTGQEMGRVNEAADRQKKVLAVVEGLMSSSRSESVEAVKGMLGLGSDTPDDIVKRIEQLIIGSVDPECNTDLAVRLCEAYPIEFYQLTNKILQLTGQGQLPGKQKSSGVTPGCETASPSATPGDVSFTK